MSEVRIELGEIALPSTEFENTTLEDDGDAVRLRFTYYRDGQLVAAGVFEHAEQTMVGNVFRLDDLRNHHLGEHGGDAILLFHFQSRHGEQMPQRVRIKGRTDETAQPEF